MIANQRRRKQDGQAIEKKNPLRFTKFHTYGVSSPERKIGLQAGKQSVSPIFPFKMSMKSLTQIDASL